MTIGYFIDSKGQYYEGDKAHPEDIEVTQRPEQWATWIDGAWVETPEDIARETQDKKNLAEYLLGQSNWAVAPDAGLTEACSQAWLAYRAALRAIVKTPTENPVFPEKPEVIYA